MERHSLGSGYITNLRVNGKIVSKRIDFKKSMKVFAAGIEVDGTIVHEWPKDARWSYDKQVVTGGVVNMFG